MSQKFYECEDCEALYRQNHIACPNPDCNGKLREVEFKFKITEWSSILLYIQMLAVIISGIGVWQSTLKFHPIYSLIFTISTIVFTATSIIAYKRLRKIPMKVKVRK